MKRRDRRSRRGAIGPGLLLIACAGSVLGDDIRPIPAEVRRQELVHLLRQDCGACHGLHLTGGLGPALLPESLRDKPADSLRQVILKGRPGTPMPGWQDFLTEAEAEWMVEAMLKGLPDER